MLAELNFIVKLQEKESTRNFCLLKQSRHWLVYVTSIALWTNHTQIDKVFPDWHAGNWFFFDAKEIAWVEASFQPHSPGTTKLLAHFTQNELMNEWMISHGCHTTRCLYSTQWQAPCRCSLGHHLFPRCCTTGQTLSNFTDVPFKGQRKQTAPVTENKAVLKLVLKLFYSNIQTLLLCHCSDRSLSCHEPMRCSTALLEKSCRGAAVPCPVRSTWGLLGLEQFPGHSRGSRPRCPRTGAAGDAPAPNRSKSRSQASPRLSTSTLRPALGVPAAAPAPPRGNPPRLVPPWGTRWQRPRAPRTRTTQRGRELWSPFSGICSR